MRDDRVLQVKSSDEYALGAHGGGAAGTDGDDGGLGFGGGFGGAGGVGGVDGGWWPSETCPKLVPNDTCVIIRTEIRRNLYSDIALVRMM